MQTITTTTFVMKSLLKQINQMYPNFKFAYSESLQYPFPEIQKRANTSENPSASSNFPVLGWNRSALRPSELGGRLPRRIGYINNTPPVPTSSNVNRYRVAHCEFDFNFTLIDKDISTIESFEIDHMSKGGLMDISQFDVDFSPSEVGIQTYQIMWNEQLGNLQTSLESNSVRSIDGSGKIYGWFISLAGEIPLINQINVNLNNTFSLIDQLTITSSTQT